MNIANNANIFISYSHRGKGPEWKGKLLRELQVFTVHDLIEAWDDEQIKGGWRWEREIEKAIHRARLAVLLLTKEALESEFILERELEPLSQREANEGLIVIPILCEPCMWNDHPWLQNVQIRPYEAKPLSAFPVLGQQRVFRQLATQIAEELSRVALNELPKPDQPPTTERIYLDRFPLTKSSGQREEKLIGREQELALLDLAFAQPHTAIVSLVAWGGVGKTMLVQQWLRRLERGRIHEDDPFNPWFGTRRVYAWSFYSQGTKEDRQASEDLFLAHALEWFGVKCEPTLSPWDKGRLLADAVASERTLLILDGIEPLQYPPGPMGGKLRAPGVQSLLKQLARKTNNTEHRGLCLVTTREPLTDLSDFQRREGSPWGSVLRIDLGNLTEEAGASLLYNAGVDHVGNQKIAPEKVVDNDELLAASREVDGHALTLNLLGRFLARAHSGDIRRRDLVKFEEADRAVQGGTTFKMLAAFENWFNRNGGFYQQSLTILRMIGLFDRPANEGCMNALRKPPVIIGLTDPLFATKLEVDTDQGTVQPLPDEAWNSANSFLADFQLLLIQTSVDDKERLLDCHPLIREHFAKQLRSVKPDAWRAAHRRLYEYLCETTKEGDQPTLEDIQPLYQAVAHGCQSGLQHEVCEKTYIARILRGMKIDGFYATRKLGAFGSDLGAVGCFFEAPWSQVSPALTAPYCAWLLNQAALRLRALGRLTEALEPMRAAIQMSTARKDWGSAAQGACNLSELELTLGNVTGAVETAEQFLSYADGSGNRHLRYILHPSYADALHQAGRPDAAEEHFREAEALQATTVAECPFLPSLWGFRYCDLLLAAAERAAWQRTPQPSSIPPSSDLLASCRAVTKRAAHTLRWAKVNNSSRLDIALDYLTWGRAEIYFAILLLGHPELYNKAICAEQEILLPQFAMETALDGLCRAGVHDYLVRGLLTRAWYRSFRGAHTGPDSAQADLDEAWDIAERGPMRLHMADIHLYRARLFFREKHYPWKSPQNDLAAAEKLINECAYHRRDEELADAKRAILGV